MWITTHLKTIMIMGPIFGLLMLGLAIALGSGVPSLASGEGRERLVGNFANLIFRIVGYGVGLLALQRFIGAPFGMSL